MVKPAETFIEETRRLAGIAREKGEAARGKAITSEELRGMATQPSDKPAVRFGEVEQELQPGPRFRPKPRQVEDPQAYYDDQKHLIEVLRQGKGFPKPSSPQGAFAPYGPDLAEATAWENVHWVYWQAEGILKQFQEFSPEEYETLVGSGKEVTVASPAGNPLHALTDALQDIGKEKGDDLTAYLATDDGFVDLLEQTVLAELAPEVRREMSALAPGQTLGPMARENIPGPLGEFIGTTLEVALDPMLWGMVAVFPPAGLAAKGGLITTIAVGAAGGEQLAEVAGLDPALGQLVGAVGLPTAAFGVRGVMAARQAARTAEMKLAQHEAFLAGATKMWHGTVEPSAQVLRRGTFWRPTPIGRGTFKGVYLSDSEAVATSAANVSARTSRQAAAVLEAEIPADLRLATEVHELAVRRALKIPGSLPGDMEKVQAELINRGFGGVRISGGRVVIFDETMVRMAGTKPPSLTPPARRGRPPRVLPAEVEGRLMPETPTLANMEQAISQPTVTRRVYRRIHQVTGRIPVLSKLHIPINPSALLTEPFRRSTAAYNALLDVMDATTRQGLMYLYRLGTPFKIDANGMVRNVVAKPGSKGRHIYDVLDRGETWYALTPAQRRWRNVYTRLLDEALGDYKAAGGDPKLLGFGPGEHYIPRSVVGKAGIDKLRRAMLEGRRIGGKRSFERPRLHEFAIDFVAEGGVYETDPLAVLQTTLNAMRASTADTQLIRALSLEGVPARSLIPADVLRAPRLAQGALDRLVRLEKFVNNPASRMPTFKGDPTLTGIRNEVRGLWDQLRAGKLTQVEYRAAVSPHRANISGTKKLLTQARVQANREVNDRLLRIRNSLIAEEGGAVPPQAFNFPEDSFAVGRLDSARWPQLRDTLFPADILREVDRAVGDVGTKWGAAAQRIGDIQRTVGAGADLNFPFLQGLPLLARNPERWAKAVLNSYRTVGQPKWGAEYMLRQANKFPEVWADYLKYSRQMGEQEWFQAVRQGGMLHKVPGAKQFYGRIGMSFDTFLDVARWEWFSSMHATAAREGVWGLEQLGAITRNGTGTLSTRGLGIGLTQRQIEGGFVFFASRYTRSAFALTFDAMQGGIRGSEARRALVNLLTGGTVAYTGIALALGQTPNLNPSEAGFMSVRVGDNWVGLPGIFRAMMRTVGFSIAAAKDDPSVFFDPRRTMDNPVFRFWRSRASPVSGRSIDIITGRDYIGRPTRSDWGDFQDLATGTLTPFVVDTFLESRGSMATRGKVVLGEYFLGRSTPVSPHQVRNEEVFKWATENGVMVHDVEGKEFVPSEYGQLPESERNRFNTEKPRFTNEVMRWRLANKRVWSAVDKISAETLSRLNGAGDRFRDSGNGGVYRQERASILERDREAKEVFFEANPADFEVKTQEQKWLQDYQENVIKASLDPLTEEPDWELQEELDRLWRRENGDEASKFINREYMASLDPTDGQFRADRIFLGDYWDLLDGVWSEEGIEAAGGLPGLADGRSAHNFRSPREYVLALQAEMYNEFKQSGLPAGLRSLKTGSAKDDPTLAERFGIKQMRSERAREAATTVADFMVREFYFFRAEIRNNFLKENIDYLPVLRRWDYLDVPQELEPYLP